MPKRSPFDFVNAITHSKQNLFNDEEVQENEYIPFLTNMALSYHLDTALYANDMNRYAGMDRRLQHDYLLHTIRPRKRFSKWAKPIDSDDLKLVQQAFGYNTRLATQALALLSKEQLRVLKEKQDVGGVKGDSRR
jgi:hypothetical protein